MLPQHNHLPLSFISRTPRSEGVPSHRVLRQEQQGKSNRFAQITETHSAAKALPPREKDAKRAAQAKDKHKLVLRRDLDFSAEIIFAKSPSVASNTEATRNKYGEKRTTDSQEMSVPATLLSPELEMDLSKYKSGNSSNLKAERTARSLQCVNRTFGEDARMHDSQLSRSPLPHPATLLAAHPSSRSRVALCCAFSQTRSVWIYSILSTDWMRR
jgi:hypothetical protein